LVKCSVRIRAAVARVKRVVMNPVYSSRCGMRCSVVRRVCLLADGKADREVCPTRRGGRFTHASFRTA
jgi:hypothetical protein